MRTNNYKKILLLTVQLLTAGYLFAQPWSEKITSPNPTLKEIQTAFNDYWKDKPVEKGKGYKQFKRWEWYWDNRVLSDGTFPKPSITWENWKAYEATHQDVLSRTASNANWTYKGPSTNDGGYFGQGRVNCMAFHPTNANIFWVGTPAGGLWKTTTGGTTWTTVTDNLPVLGVSDIAIDPTNANIMYIATGDGEPSGSTQQIGSLTAGDSKSIGVLKSTDGGNTWNTTGLTFSVTASKLIRRLLINPSNPQILIAAASDGIWRTSNGGTTWTNVQAGYFIDAEFKPGDPTTVYASTYEFGNAKIYRSTNSGSNWTLSATIAQGRRINLTVSAAATNLVDAVVTNTNGGLLGLWYSGDFGATFSNYFTPTASQNMLNADATKVGGQGDYDLAYVMNPANANEIWLGGVNTWRSTNGGTAWTLKNFWAPSPNTSGVPTVHADKHFFAYHPLQPGTLFECHDGGISKTTDGGNTWTDLFNGLGITQIYRIGTAATAIDMVSIGTQDNGSRGLAGNTWFNLPGGDGMETIIDYTNENRAYTSYANGEIYRTTDGGTNWPTIVYTNGTGVNSRGEWITPYVLHPTVSSTMLIGKSQIYRSLDFGSTWTQLGTITLPVGEMVRHLAYSPSNPSVIYAASRTLLLKSINGGASWSSIANGGSGYPFTYITPHPTNSNLVYVTLGGYEAGVKVYLVNSATTPSTLTDLSGTLPNVPANCIVYQKNTNDALYLGTDVGVFYRNGTMTDWIPYQTNLPNVMVTEMEISYNNNKLWAGTFGRGLWNTNLYTSLPLSLVQFTAAQQNKEVLLKWTTANEINTKEFEVQKSTDGVNFSLLSTVISLNTSGNNNYSIVDKNPVMGNNYYRLKMIDKDNSFTYSPVKNIVFKEKQSMFTVYPNPAKDNIRIDFTNTNTKKEITLIDAQGKELLRKVIPAGEANHMIKTAHLPNGVYHLRMKTNDELMTEKIIVSH